jgi:hypothetical protein
MVLGFQDVKYSFMKRIFFFFLPIFWGKWTGDHPQDDLAQVIEKSIKFSEPYILVTCLQLWSKSGDLYFFSSKYGNIVRQDLCWINSLFFLSPSGGISPQEKHCSWIGVLCFSSVILKFSEFFQQNRKISQIYSM